MLPTPASSLWFSSAALMASRRPRKRAANSSAADAERLRARRAESLAAAQVAKLQPSKSARVHKAQLPGRWPGSGARAYGRPRGQSGVVTSSRPRHAQMHDPLGDRLMFRPPAKSLPPAGPPNSQTMCFPVRCTSRNTRPSSPWLCRLGGVLKGSRCLLNQASTMRSPRTRSCTPRAMVSTSGSSGIHQL